MAPTKKSTGSPLSEADQRLTLQPSETIAASPPPTKSPISPYPTPHPEITLDPTSIPETKSPTMLSTSKYVSTFFIPDLSTTSPTMATEVEGRLAYFPHSEPSLPPPTANTMRMLHIVESIQSSLQDSIFVTETRNGGLIPSALYTYDGFVESLIFYTKFGVDGKFFYLGGERPSSVSSKEPQNLEIGIANLALFLAKMMQTITYERCEPNRLSCGIPALHKAFEEQNIKIQCSPNSSDEGKECPIESGCACVLGILQHHLGMQSESVLSTGKYSGVDFCETNVLQSFCSSRTDQGAELRWITAISFWVFFIQQYTDENGWSYLEELHQFVSGGMLDVSFVDAVGVLSVLGTEDTTVSVGFKANFFKAMVMLSEGHGMYPSISQHETSSPSKRKTSSPSKRETSIPVAPTPDPISSSPSTPPTGSIPINPTHMPTELSVNPTNAPFLSASNDRKDFMFAASVAPTISAGVPTTAANSQKPFSSDNGSSPPTVFSGVATSSVMAVASSQQPAVSSNENIVPPAVSSNIATPAGNDNTTILYPSTAPVGPLPTTRRWHWQHGDLAWYRPSTAPGHKVITVFMIMITLSFYLLL